MTDTTETWLKDQMILTLNEIKQIRKDIRLIKNRQTVIGEDLILDFKDVCQILHLSERQTRRLTAEKKLVGFRMGHKRMFRSSEINTYLKNLSEINDTRREE